MFSRKEILDRQTALITGGASGIGHASDPFNDRKRKRNDIVNVSLHWRIDRRFPGNSLWYEQSWRHQFNPLHFRTDYHL